RTALKAVAVAGAALIVPSFRLPRAGAATRPPCFAVCHDLAFEALKANRNLCTFYNLKDFVLGFFDSKYVDCYATAQVTWRRDWLDCDQPECGDPGKYPGG